MNSRASGITSGVTPNTSIKMVSRNNRAPPTVSSTSATIKVKALPTINSARSTSLRPSEMDTIAAAPTPTSMPTAINKVMTGKAMVTAVKAASPTPWPTKIPSITL